MARSTKRGREVRNWILHQVVFYPRRIVSETCQHFGITRQSVSRHIARLCQEGLLVKWGKATRKNYALATPHTWSKEVDLRQTDEGREWSQWAAPALAKRVVNPNVLEICQHGFTEMLNNAIDHSESGSAELSLALTASTIQMSVRDHGVGIFRKIAREMDLPDEREAVIELSKGKLTTDSARHSGEGIFFTSRMFDSFTIDSCGLYFDHTPKDDWLIEVDAPSKGPGRSQGTLVTMSIFRDSLRSVQEVFDRFATAEAEFAFARTHVPLSLAQYGTELLISRSQARRVLARFDRFEEVILDFKNVPRIGQAFADEIFRVHMLAHPDAKILVVNAVQAVRRMIARAKGALGESRRDA